MSRKAAGIVALGAIVGLGGLELSGRVDPDVTQSAPPADLIQFNRRAEVSRADLDYRSPATRSEEGMPLGTGRMGTLIWTSPSAIRMQINRVDVHAMDSSSFSFGRADTDYGYGCGYIDINLVGAGEDVFTPAKFHQHLSVYEGAITVEGAGVRARAVALPMRDVIAIEIDDERAQPEAITVDVRTLRSQMQFTPGQTVLQRQNHSMTFRTGAHTATSTLAVEDGRVTLAQEFKEDAFYGASGLAVAAIGRPSRARHLNETTAQLSIAPRKGRVVVLIGSAAADSASRNAARSALDEIRSVEPRPFDALRQDTAGWWAQFWDAGAVALKSASGQAEFVQANYDFFLYLMGASSRGDFPPRFGGMIWQTDGDMMRWGSQYWWANTSTYYANLMPSNRLDLIVPMFKLYWGMFDAGARAARQQWGSEGVWIPETTFFNGPENLPADIAQELQDLMLVRKPWDQRSAKFDWFANNKNRHNSRWNFRADGPWDHGYYMFQNKGQGVFGQTTHILGVASRIANLAWQRYQFTGDRVWLRDRAYPFIRASAEFYRHFPNLQKDAGGVYHINHTNSGESDWNSRDASYEVTCMHMIFPLAVRASQELGIDAELRPMWQEIKTHLVDPRAGSLCGTGSEIADTRPYGGFVYNGPGAIEPIGAEPELKSRFLGFTRLGSFIDAPGAGGAQIFRNRLRLREGPGAIDAEHIAGLAGGIHATLLSSHPDSTTNEEPVSVFNQWPKDWDAAFRLLARGGFVVKSVQQGGRIPLVEITSQIGGPMRLSNPWPQDLVTVYRRGASAEELSGPVLTIQTKSGERVVLGPKGTTLRVVRID